MQQGESTHEYFYPYQGQFSTYVCPNVQKWSSGKKVSSIWYDYQCTEAKLQAMVYAYGSAVSTMNASGLAFGNYAGGIFNGCPEKTYSNHAVTVVGWGTDPVGGDYWIIKNSWGPGWGKRGFMQIKRGVNMCNIGTYCYAVQATDSQNGAIGAPPLPPADTCDFTNYFGRSYNGTYNFSNFGKSFFRCKILTLLYIGILKWYAT